MNERDLAIEIAWRAWGLPYRWGGDDPLKGFDCSGLMVELLKSTGLIGNNEDFTAAGLWTFFEKKTVSDPYPGCMVFWWDDPIVRHVELCLDGEFSIGASGGGHKVKTEKDAEIHNAYIKIRPLFPRGALKIRGFIDPFLNL